MKIATALSMAAAALAIAACTSAPMQESGNHRLTNTVTWSTASESNNFGFDIYRGEQNDGPFERITAQPVLGAGTTDLPRDYRFVDREIEAGKIYFYYVESISLSGERKRFTPVMKAPAKQPPIKTPEDG
ncbi:MAG: hypothetical protein WD397_16295 [Wenzhouxiangellaceae bacterium]